MAQNSDFEGISKLWFGMLFLMLAPILEIVGFVVFSFYSPYYSSSFGGISGLSSLSVIIGGLSLLTFILFIPSGAIALPVSETPAEATFLGLIAAAVALGIFGLLKIYSGFSSLKSTDKDVGTKNFGIYTYLFSFIMIIIGGPLLINTSTEVGGVMVLIVGNIFGIIATVFLGIIFYKLGETYNETIIKMGSILFVIPNSNVIGNIIIFMGLNQMKKKLAPPVTYQSFYPPAYQQPYQQPQPSYQPLPQQALPQQTPQSPQIYQIEQGVIGSNGYAKVTLNSSVPANIVSARIDGTNITAINVKPPILQTGKNDVIINFGNVSSLTPGEQYKVILTVNARGNMIDVTTYVNYPS
ncbi:DUF973 family protein [Acidianus sp. RZ1]|uniref:DUF973 family protein n=1 Tax=Acidianus sp. RZ1 TaxID=1540082 RepID=UPI0014909102|nr:DUF973 family protein [Acidianus sp. RZ1]NON61634.1 DUF973 family protein [Acidianus sp. RZ1]